MTHPAMIEDQAALVAFCERARSADFLTVDTEFVREKTYYPLLCLVQVATAEEAVAIDPLAEAMDLAPLFALMTETDMPKVFHAAGQDLEIFANLAGALPSPLFDTQIAAMVCGFGEQVGYERLARALAGAELDKTARYTDWSRRPLTETQIDYALGDVTHLRTVFVELTDRLTRENRVGWVQEEMAAVADLKRYQTDVRDAWRRLKPRGDKPQFLNVLVAVAAWREREAQRRDVPRNRIIRDDTVMEIAASAPKNAGDLGQVRGYSENAARGKQGTAILEAVQEGLAQPRDAAPKLKKRKPLSDAAAQGAALLRVLLKSRAENADVAQRIVANAEELEQLAERGAGADVPALSGWRRDLFGEAALELLAGRLYIGFEDGKVAERKTP
jgi:ribonuclease D